MPLTQIIGITLIILAFIATVRVFISGFKAFKINRLELELLKIETKVKFEYNTMTPDEVNKLFIRDTKIKQELFKLKNRK